MNNIRVLNERDFATFQFEIITLKITHVQIHHVKGWHDMFYSPPDLSLSVDIAMIS